VILGEDELAQGKVRWKEMGLRDGHPEKEGVLVALDDLVTEAKQRLARKKELDELTRQAQGLRVVHGIKGDEVKVDETTATLPPTQPQEASTSEVPS
jgi:histidyl-tRNA synthetase